MLIIPPFPPTPLGRACRKQKTHTHRRTQTHRSRRQSPEEKPKHVRPSYYFQTRTKQNKNFVNTKLLLTRLSSAKLILLNITKKHANTHTNRCMLAVLSAETDFFVPFRRQEGEKWATKKMTTSTSAPAWFLGMINSVPELLHIPL